MCCTIILNIFIIVINCFPILKCMIHYNVYNDKDKYLTNPWASGNNFWRLELVIQIALKQCQSQLKIAKNRRLKVLYCNADTFTQEKKHELQVLMAEDQPDIVAMTEVIPKGRSYKIDDIKIRANNNFESNLSCVGRCGSACSLTT